MFKYQNRGIATLVVIGIIAVLVVVVGGGILSYKYLSPQKNNNQQQNQNQQQTPNNQTNNTQPSITIVSPNGGEVWEVGKTYNITWTVPNKPQIGFDGKPIDKMTIIIERPPTEQNFSANITSDISVSQGKFSWTIPSSIPAAKFNFTNSNTYKVSLWYRESLIDSSDNYFTITSANQVAGWQTYTNTQYGFEFKYPSDWKFKSGYFIKNIYEKDFSCSEFYGTCTAPEISVVVQPYNMVEENWLKEIVENKSTKETVLIGNKMITKVDMTDPNVTDFNAFNARSFYYVLDSKEINSLIIFHTYTNNKELASYKSVIEQMISTFKFTK
ncbi:MAG: Ser-Thr-rich GPI-anchored membrane family protein [Patescibacteria group bacterium]